QGPLLVHWAVGTGALDSAPVDFLDIKTLKQLDVKGGNRGHCFRDALNIRASADGRVFGLWQSGVSPSGLKSYVLSGDTVREYYDHTSVGQIVPSPDGKILYTGGGLYTNEVKPLGKREANAGVPLPAVHGHYY